MEIGTHNSMTYLKPKKWYMYPFQFIARCQSKTIQEQYEDYNIRLFDIRIKYDYNGDPEFRHGSMAYKGNVYEILSYLNSRKEHVKVRIILETKKEDKINERYFVRDLFRFYELYPNITFYEGRRKFDWKQLMTLPTLNVRQIISSMDESKLNDLWPWLYAKRYNHNNLLNCKEDETVLMDFIEKQ